MKARSKANRRAAAIVAAAVPAWCMAGGPARAQFYGSSPAWGTQGAACAAPPAGEAKSWLNAGYSPECRARYALGQFRTVDEKLLYISPPRRLPPPPSPPPAGEAAPAPASPFGEPATATCAYAPQVTPVYVAPPGPSASASPPRGGGGGGGGGFGGGAPEAPSKVRDVAAVLGLPAVGRGSDGPAGVRGANCVTAFNTPLSVAATFDPAMAARYGDLVGRDFHDAGYNFQLGPAMDLTRTWRFGRTTESFGEDPFLTAAIVGPEIHAIASNHVVSQMKHFAAYTQEAGRVGDPPSGQKPAGNEAIGERALREIYLPGFEAAVKVGGAGQVMCAFPRINGVYACENPYTLRVLKEEWGFDGTVGPDFPSAQRSIVPAVLAGLDSGTMEPNGGTFAGQIGLREAVARGIVPEARLDDMILRRLVPQFRVGVFEHPARRIGPDVSTPERRAAVADLVMAGAVLLKNRGAVLPLGPRVRSVAVIGAQATERAQVVEQGSAIVNVQHLEPVLGAVRRRAGPAVKVAFAQGTYGLEPLPPVPSGQLRTPDGQPGVQAEYFANPDFDFSAAPAARRVEPSLGLAGMPQGVQLPPDQLWTARYTARFTPAASGMQKFTVHVGGSVRLFIDGKLMGTTERADFGDAVYAFVPGTAGRAMDIRIEYCPRGALGPGPMAMFGAMGGTQVKVGYAPPDALIADAVRAARAADVAVVFVGHKVGEGMDRTSLALPNDQDALIEAVAAANPRTVVVLNTGGAVTMPWLDRVAAVMEMWLPGDAAGPAAAKLLFGDADPGGRLPVTFPRNETQGPATHPFEYPGTLDGKGQIDTAWFDEGSLIGYRWWDAHGQAPLFPFGYGLSYTSFALRGASLQVAPDGGADVAVEVRNTGARAGSEVVQVYVGLPARAGAPPRQLKGLAKVALSAGQSQQVRIHLDRRAFQYWDEARNGWSDAAAGAHVMVGTSSRDIAWKGAMPG